MPTLVRHCDATPQALWRVVSDVEAWPGLLTTVDAVRRLTAGDGLTRGDRFEVAQPKLRPAVYEVTDVDEGRSFTWVARTSGVTTTARHAIDPKDGKSTLTLSVDWAGPLAFVAHVGYGRMTRRYIATEADAMEQAAREG